MMETPSEIHSSQEWSTRVNTSFMTSRLAFTLWSSPQWRLHCARSNVISLSSARNCWARKNRPMIGILRHHSNFCCRTAFLSLMGRTTRMIRSWSSWEIVRMHSKLSIIWEHTGQSTQSKTASILSGGSPNKQPGAKERMRRVRGSKPVFFSTGETLSGWSITESLKRRLNSGSTRLNKYKSYCKIFPLKWSVVNVLCCESVGKKVREWSPKIKFCYS